MVLAKLPTVCKKSQTEAFPYSMEHGRFDGYCWQAHPQAETPTEHSRGDRYTNGLTSARKQGFITSFDNLLEYIGNEPNKAVERLPSFPGFLWPDLAEAIIEEVWAGEGLIYGMP